MGEHLTERRRFQRDHLRSCNDSGLSMKAYAEAHGLKPAQLYSWKAKLGQLDLPTRPTVSTGTLVPIRVAPERSLIDHCRIELRNGIRLDWPLAGDMERLSELLGVLEGHG